MGFCLCPGLLVAQNPDSTSPPLDGVVKKELASEERVLPYPQIREADLMWEKRIWRVVDVREKLNLPFAYPERPFFSILLEGVESGELTAYSTEDDRFSQPLSGEEIENSIYQVDTIIVADPELNMYGEQFEVVRTGTNPADIKRFRLKELWYFDEATSTMRVRILGIAPLKEKYDDNGNFRYEYPLFWIYYPDARELLARETVHGLGNESSPVSYEDLLEMRRFSSYIYKESNVRDRRIQDYLSGVDLLMEADQINQELFNFEHDLWSY